MGTTVVGRSGQSYFVEISGAEVPELQHLLFASYVFLPINHHRTRACQRLLLSSGNLKYILKDLEPSSFDDIVATYQETAGCAHVHQLHDTIPN